MGPCTANARRPTVDSRCNHESHEWLKMASKITATLLWLAFIPAAPSVGRGRNYVLGLSVCLCVRALCSCARARWRHSPTGLPSNFSCHLCSPSHLR